MVTMILKEELFPLPPPLLEPAVVKDFYPVEMFNRVKDKVNSLGMHPEGRSQYHTMIGRWESSVLFDKDIEEYSVQRAKEIFKDDTLLKAYFFVVRYQKHQGCIPHLWEHVDQNGTQTSIDLTIENTANWDLIVEGVSYNQMPNEAVVFAGQQHMHARPPYPSDREDVYTTVLFMHFTQPDHWIQDDKRGLYKYGKDGDARFFNRNRYIPMPDPPVEQPVCKCHDYSNVLRMYDDICGEYVDEETEIVEMPIIEKKVLAPGIMCYSTTAEAARTLKGLMQNACYNLWTPAQILDQNRQPSVSYSARKCYTKFIYEQALTCHPQDPMRRLYESLTRGIEPVIADYSTRYSTTKLKSKNWQLTRYEVGHGFHNHVDDSSEYPRVASVSILLNDDYEGGELYFEHFKIAAPSTAGSIIVFGSSFPFMHRVNPVTRGTRYAAVRWYNYIDTSYTGV
jgi:hypothetical protein